MNERQYRNTLGQRFPRASKAFLDANRPQNTGTPAKLERAVSDGALAAGEGEEASSERVHIRFVSVRKRLLDPDNLSEKWMLDCLRYCRVIRGDEPDKITLETTQRKAAKGEEEHTLLTIERITPD